MRAGQHERTAARHVHIDVTHPLAKGVVRRHAELLSRNEVYGSVSEASRRTTMNTAPRDSSDMPPYSLRPYGLRMTRGGNCFRRFAGMLRIRSA